MSDRVRVLAPKLPGRVAIVYLKADNPQKALGEIAHRKSAI